MNLNLHIKDIHHLLGLVLKMLERAQKTLFIPFSGIFIQFYFLFCSSNFLFHSALSTYN